MQLRVGANSLFLPLKSRIPKKVVACYTPISIGGYRIRDDRNKMQMQNTGEADPQIWHLFYLTLLQSLKFIVYA